MTTTEPYVPRSRRKAQIAARLRQVRVEQFGDDGLQALAARLGVPAATWRNYELGVTIPGEVLLQFLEVTGADPGWLLRGPTEPTGLADPAVRCP